MSHSAMVNDVVSGALIGLTMLLAVFLWAVVSTPAEALAAAETPAPGVPAAGTALPAAGPPPLPVRTPARPAAATHGRRAAAVQPLAAPLPVRRRKPSPPAGDSGAGYRPRHAGIPGPRAPYQEPGGPPWEPAPKPPGAE